MDRRALRNRPRLEDVKTAAQATRCVGKDCLFTHVLRTEPYRGKIVGWSNRMALPWLCWSRELATSGFGHAGDAVITVGAAVPDASTGHRWCSANKNLHDLEHVELI